MIKLIKRRRLLAAIILVMCVVGCDQVTAQEAESMEEASIDKRLFGTLADGTSIDKYTLTNENGMMIDIITYGGIITSWTAPDKKGRYHNVVLGYDELASYLKGHPYFGAIVGRYGNRIAEGKFTLDGQTYELEKNLPPHHLHGGLVGFDKMVWEAKVSKGARSVSLILSHTSKDMTGGFPGNLETTVTYTLTHENALEIDYHATTDKPTIVNLTQHSYFNLSGDFTRDIHDHELQMSAEQILVTDDKLIPTGEIPNVKGTPFDFTATKVIGRDIDQLNEQLGYGGGYDHCWVFGSQGQLDKVATLSHPSSGRSMEVFTTEPGMQLYTGNFLEGDYKKRSALCLETQHYPDAPNHPSFPSTVLRPGEVYQSKTVYKFSVMESRD